MKILSLCRLEGCGKSSPEVDFLGALSSLTTHLREISNGNIRVMITGKQRGHYDASKGKLISVRVTHYVG